MDAWVTLRNEHAYESDKAKALLEHLLAMVMILIANSSRILLSAADSTDVRNHTDEVLGLSTALAQHVDDEGFLLWKVVPKHHWLWHLAQKADHLNPGVGRCTLDEDFVGKQKLAVAACVQGTR